jgi:hypothetical protein
LDADLAADLDVVCLAEALCDNALPAADLEALLVLDDFRVLEAFLAAFLLVTLLLFALPVLVAIALPFRG